METAIAPSPRPVAPARRGVGLTVLVPAYNEEGSIADTIRSLKEQSVAVDEIVVIDDCSTDHTGDVARCLGATVLRPRSNTGSKAGAQTFALAHVRTPYVMAIDADTILDPHAVERILPALREPGIAAACGLVLPRHVRTIWERGRYVEYLFAFTFYKPIQDHYARPLISSGCFSVYRTEVVRACGGWSNRTMAEDMDLTWTLYSQGYGVRFVPEAVSYPIEPHDFGFLSKQLRRWSHGFIQNVRVHWRRLLHEPLLRSMVAVGLWDAAVASLAFLVVVPLAALLVSPLFLLAYLIDLPAVLVPALVGAWRRKETKLALRSLPGFFVLRLVNGAFMLRALCSEFLLRRTLTVYEKGH
jgi:biofilm PGA synthesis N-glycosyltransferase PgaC